MRKILILLSLFLLAGCSHPKVEESKPSGSQQTLDDLYQRGKAERIKGSADDCLKTFGKIIDLRKTIQDGLYAYSLYQSGLCYEIKNQNEKAIAVYQDALRVRAIVNSELADLEIPSRLAVTYSRIGDGAVAEKYYTQTKNYIQHLKNKENQLQSKKEYYAEVLFQMGTIANEYQSSKENNSDFESYLKSIRYSQDYLMLVLELNVQPYASLALTEMINNFQKTFDQIKNLKKDNSDDSVVAERNKQMIQKNMSEQLATHIDEFETISSVEKKSKREDFKEIFAKLKEIKIGLDSIINERPLGEGLTPEAQKLQEPKIKGNFAPIKGDKE
jgi:tetratricopeptide (TPR) repeat protein